MKQFVDYSSLKSTILIVDDIEDNRKLLLMHCGTLVLDFSG